MFFKMLVLVCLLSTPSLADWAGWTDWRPPDKYDKTAFIATQALILADITLTLNLHNNPKFGEGNPLLGTRPNATQIIGVMLLEDVAYTAAWYHAPPNWRNILSIAAIAIESACVYRGVVYTIKW